MTQSSKKPKPAKKPETTDAMCPRCWGQGEYENCGDSLCQFQRCEDCNGTGKFIVTFPKKARKK